MNVVFVKPREGARIRAADGTPIPPEGLAVVRCHYIERRLHEGDLVVADEAGADSAVVPEARSSRDGARGAEPVSTPARKEKA